MGETEMIFLYAHRAAKPTNKANLYYVIDYLIGWMIYWLIAQAGDSIQVTNRDEADWWRGSLGDKTGVFPSNYVEPAKCKLTLTSQSLLFVVFCSVLIVKAGLTPYRMPYSVWIVHVAISHC